MFCEGCGSLLLSIPVDGAMQCGKEACAGKETTLENHFTKSSMTEALPMRDYTVISRLQRPTTDAYECPKCRARKATTELRQMDQTDEPEVLFLECMGCGHGWREA
jgi:DNA-directed RNA polymerase subunit M/transcription elongation factor TFIIS